MKSWPPTGGAVPWWAGPVLLQAGDAAAANEAHTQAQARASRRRDDDAEDINCSGEETTGKMAGARAAKRRRVLDGGTRGR
ncbi:hypothetical protein tb265_05950 [Gemmatimonadetes bacterium T265]|nr:hypothetical protein tb265_05950 [Gemmatimonadetes bacterium T265]